MRIAVMIISLCMTLIVALQSCAVFVGGGLSKDEGLSQGGASGIFLAFLFVLGAAFSLNLPRVSMVMFIIGSLIGAAGASAGGFKDMWVWAGLSLVLAVMSYFGSRELRRKATATGK